MSNIVIPSALRKKYGLAPGSIVDVKDREGEIVVSVRLGYKQARGMLVGGPSLTEDLLAERAREREREERRIQQAPSLHQGSVDT